MFNVCSNCGQYAEEKAIDPTGPFAICPFCGHRHRFVQLPLFIVTGASGTGKSTVCLTLASLLTECICLESDNLWRSEFATPEDNYRGYRNLWLRVAKNISQSGRPVVLFGTALPEQFENCPERRYFSALHYLAFACDDNTVMERLQSRPTWRKSGTPESVSEMRRFNRWIKEHADTTTPPMTVLDTSHLSVAESVAHTATWIHQHMSAA